MQIAFRAWAAVRFIGLKFLWRRVGRFPARRKRCRFGRRSRWLRRRKRACLPQAPRGASAIPVRSPEYNYKRPGFQDRWPSCNSESSIAARKEWNGRTVKDYFERISRPIPLSSSVINSKARRHVSAGPAGRPPAPRVAPPGRKRRVRNMNEPKIIPGRFFEMKNGLYDVAKFESVCRFVFLRQRRLKNHLAGFQHVRAAASRRRHRREISRSRLFRLARTSTLLFPNGLY